MKKNISFLLVFLLVLGFSFAEENHENSEQSKMIIEQRSPHEL